MKRPGFLLIEILVALSLFCLTFLLIAKLERHRSRLDKAVHHHKPHPIRPDDMFLQTLKDILEVDTIEGHP